MNPKLQLIREKCIAANPALRELAGNMTREIDGEYKFTEIRLADVLLAIEKTTEDMTKTRIVLDTNGEFVRHRNFAESGYVKEAFWNLRADDLEKQSEETINFLYELLK